MYVVTQDVDGTRYFEAAFDAPADAKLGHSFLDVPRLVPQGRGVTAVHGEGFKFWGKVRYFEPVACRLLYAGKAGPCEADVTIDLTGAPPVDLGYNFRIQWAKVRAAELAAAEWRTPDVPFYRFARQATEARFRLLPTAFAPAASVGIGPSIYDLFAGGAALSESLALDRTPPGGGAGGERSVPIAKLAGIDIPERPWEKMLAGRTPAAEPAAALTPFDHYYATFRTPAALADCGDLLDDSGGNLLRALDVSGRDEMVRARYELQLGLPSRKLAAELPAGLVRGVTLTGSDPYLRTGSDVTVLLHTPRPADLLTVLGPVAEGQWKPYAAQVQRDRLDHHGTAVEMIRTPLREVSCYRAAVGEWVVVSNSRIAIERVLDTQAGRRKPLVDALDFRYARTVFRADDVAEDGFVFLPDAFIRTLVTPAARIGEKRRMEALTALTRLNYAVLFHAWETGSLPADAAAALATSGLRGGVLAMPEGPPAAWDAGRRVAVSPVYNTRQFLTPLIELPPVDRVTLDGERGYQSPANEYLDLWLNDLRPTGLRIHRGAEHTRLETNFLPRSNRPVREQAGVATLPVGVARPSVDAAFHVAMALPEADRKKLGFAWVALTLDDAPELMAVAERAARHPNDSNEAATRELDQRLTRLPLVVSFGTANAKGPVAWLSKGWHRKVGPWFGKGDGRDTSYKGVTVTRHDVDAENMQPLLDFAGSVREFGAAAYGSAMLNLGMAVMILEAALLPSRPPDAVYTATIGGAYHVSLSEDALKRRIDRTAVSPMLADSPVTATLTLGAIGPQPAARKLLAWQTQRHALGSSAAWLALHRVGLLADDATDADRRSAAWRHFGYIPVSPDGGTFRYDRRIDEVVHDRHGSPRNPKPPTDVVADSSLGRLLARFQAVHADVRYREDGIHTTVTLDHRPLPAGR